MGSQRDLGTIWRVESLPYEIMLAVAVEYSSGRGERDASCPVSIRKRAVLFEIEALDKFIAGILLIFRRLILRVTMN